MFRSLFNNEKSLLELYNALHGTSHSEGDTEIVINALDKTLVSQRKNDISFLLNGRLVVMMEHLSSAKVARRGGKAQAGNHVRGQGNTRCDTQGEGLYFELLWKNDGG